MTVADVKVMGASLLAVIGTMLSAVLGVQCLKLVMLVASLVMLDTEGEVNWLGPEQVPVLWGEGECWAARRVVGSCR